MKRLLIEYELPMDILIEIFKRLTIESLIRLTSVSKTWKSIIHSTRFIADYNGPHIQPHHLLFVGYTYRNYVDIFDDDGDISFLQRLTLPMSAEHPGFRFKKFIGYSQGLFGFHCYNNDNVTPRNDSFVIWNPSIRKTVFVPVPDGTDFVFTVCNATDPTIFITTYIVGSGWQVEIFTLSTGVGVWRTLPNAPRESLQYTRMRVVIDKFIHWIVFDRTSEGYYLDNLILSYDITSEQFTELCLPPTLATHTSLAHLRLSELREFLVVLEEDVCKDEIGVWIMMEPGVQNSFTKLYTVKPPYTREFPTVLGFRKNDQPIIFSHIPTHESDLEKCSKQALLFYESDLERFNDIEIPGYGYPSTAGSYMETLLLFDY